jgi:hypothetical protein
MPHGCVEPAQKLSKPHRLEIFMETSSIGMIDELNLQLLFPPQRVKEWGLNVLSFCS